MALPQGLARVFLAAVLLFGAASSARAADDRCAKPGTPDRAEGRFVRHMGEGFTATLDAKLDGEIPGFVFSRLREILDHVRRHEKAACALIADIEAIEIFASDPFDRYVGWKGDDERGVLQMAVGAFLDSGPGFTARAIALELVRRRNPDGPLDPYARRMGRFRVYGSVYPDAGNDAFFTMMEKTLAMADDLPAEQRRILDRIDEIRYTPHSKHFVKAGQVDSTIAFYNRAVGGAGNRVVTVRQNVRWTVRANLLLTLVHEGTHVVQHEKADHFRQVLQARRGKTGEPARGANRGKGAPAAQAAMTDYLERWERGKDGGSSGQPDIAFECEATVNEIEAAIALDLPASLVEDSQYLRVCDGAKRMMVRWQDRRLREAARGRKH